MGSCSCVRLNSDHSSLPGLTIKQNSEFSEVYLDTTPKPEDLSKKLNSTQASTLSSSCKTQRKNLESAFLKNPLQRMF